MTAKQPDFREVAVATLEAIGQELAEHADQYIGPLQKYTTDIDLHIHIEPGEIPTIEVEKSLAPESVVRKYQIGEWRFT